MSSAAVSNGLVYVGSNDHNIYALNATNGGIVWNYTTGDVVISSPAVFEGLIYVGSYDRNVYALSASDGSVKWNFTSGGSVASSPAVSDGAVYVGSDDGKVYALNATSGLEDWSFQTGGKVASSPAVTVGLVYVGSDDGRIYALNSSSGKALWSYRTDDMVVSSPTVADGTLYVGSYDHAVYAFGSKNQQPCTITFIQSGLPSGTCWGVSFNNQTHVSDSENVTFSLANGTLTYIITQPFGYAVTPKSGTLNLASQNFNVQVTFESNSQPQLLPFLMLAAFVFGLSVAVLALLIHKERNLKGDRLSASSFNCNVPRK
jgi:outer membrane protein assembly factor BamB